MITPRAQHARHSASTDGHTIAPQTALFKSPGLGPCKKGHAEHNVGRRFRARCNRAEVRLGNHELQRVTGRGLRSNRRGAIKSNVYYVGPGASAKAHRLRSATTSGPHPTHQRLSTETGPDYWGWLGPNVALPSASSATTHDRSAPSARPRWSP